jgi:beta-glucosidase
LLSGQKELISQITALGKPTCAFVNSGTTLNLSELSKQVPAQSRSLSMMLT